MPTFVAALVRVLGGPCVGMNWRKLHCNHVTHSCFVAHVTARSHRSNTAAARSHRSNKSAARSHRSNTAAAGMFDRCGPVVQRVAICMKCQQPAYSRFMGLCMSFDLCISYVWGWYVACVCICASILENQKISPENKRKKSKKRRSAHLGHAAYAVTWGHVHIFVSDDSFCPEIGCT